MVGARNGPRGVDDEDLVDALGVVVVEQLRTCVRACVWMLVKGKVSVWQCDACVCGPVPPHAQTNKAKPSSHTSEAPRMMARLSPLVSAPSDMPLASKMVVICANVHTRTRNVYMDRSIGRPKEGKRVRADRTGPLHSTHRP